MGCSLQFEGEDLRGVETNFNKLVFNMPTTSSEKLDAIIDFCTWITSITSSKEIELEAASIYAEQLGFEKHMVGEIFQSLTTAYLHNKDLKSVKADLKSILG